MVSRGDLGARAYGQGLWGAGLWAGLMVTRGDLRGRA